MLGKLFEKSRRQVAEGVTNLAVKKTYDLSTDLTGRGEGAGIPHAPVNPYKKRPVKLVYDKNEFHNFRLPSEQHFLFNTFDHQDIFGERKGINHSPHIQAQINLDNNLIWGIMIITVLMYIFEQKNHREFLGLRKNLLNSDMAKLTIEDFK